MANKKFFVNVDVQNNDVVNLKADTLDITSNLASANTKRIVYWSGQYYYSNGTSWVNISGGSSPTPSLQDVTDIGNTTSNSIVIDAGGFYGSEVGETSIRAYKSDTGSYTELQGNGALALNSNIGNGVLTASDVQTGETVQLEFPDKPTGTYTIATTDDIISGTVTSVGLTMPSAFTVTNSPITTSGDIAVTGSGLASQYVRGDGSLASFPDIAGGGGGQVFYFNGGTSQGTIGGAAFEQLSAGAVIGTGVNFTSGTVDDVAFANFITDVGKPTQETIPAGVWIFQCYLSASSTNVCEIYATVEVYNGTTFTVLSTSSVEVITNGTTVDLYTFTCAVPEYTPLTPTDRVAIRFYPNNLASTNTITLNTQGTNLGSVQTTFTTGIAALDGLTAASQYLQTGTTGSDFNITTSGSDTHVFNLPTASSSNRGALSSSDWTTFNSKLSVLQVTPVTLTVAGWSLVSGFYEYTYSNANILSTSIVDIIPANASVSTVRTADIMPSTSSSSGSVKIYATNLPTANITVTVNIYN